MQKFKEYDKKFSAYLNSILETGIDIKDAESIYKWEYHEKLILWTRIQIANAVYTSETAEEWQKFRVSLKGNSVKLKLLRLQKRYEKNVVRDFGNIQYGWQYKGEEDEVFLEKIRIDNYIGALRRQMSLNEEYLIVKEI